MEFSVETLVVCLVPFYVTSLLLQRWYYNTKIGRVRSAYRVRRRRRRRLSVGAQTAEAVDRYLKAQNPKNTQPKKKGW